MMRRWMLRNGPGLIVMNMSIRKRIWWKILAFILAAALAAAVGIYGWQRGAFLPDWIVWQEKRQTVEEESGEILLKERNLTLKKDGKAVWKSPKEILVQDFLWCDINHDTKEELILLCWRIGRYGDAKPFWIEEDEKQWSQHIYIYQWAAEEVHPLWMASDIGMEAAGFSFDEKKRLEITETNGRVTYWDWMSWGLTLIGEEDSENTLQGRASSNDNIT